MTNPQKVARHALGQAIRSGKIVRPSKCEKCGAPDTPLKDGRSCIQGHHHNGYESPFDVQWLCVSCHRKDTPAPFGERAGAAKMTWAKVTFARRQHQGGRPYRAIAAELNLNPKTVYQIVMHRSWPEHARPEEQAQ